MMVADSAAAAVEAAPPAAIATAERASAAGTAALAPAACAARTTPTAPAVMPRRVNRSRSRRRALSSRCRSVGSVQRRRHGGLLVGQALEVAEDHRQPLAIGQTVELLVHDGSDLGVGIGRGVRCFERRHGHGLRLSSPPSLGIALRVHGGAVGDAVQPAAQRVAGADRAGRTRQDQEGGLECVLDVVLLLQHGAAGGQDHRAMPRDQGLEGGLVAVGDIPGQELAIAESDRAAVVEQVAEVPQGAPQYADGHDAPLSECPARRGRCPSPLAPLVKG